MSTPSNTSSATYDPAPWDHMQEYSTHFLWVPTRKLLVCRIDKVASSLLSDVLCSLNKQHASREYPARAMVDGIYDFEEECDHTTAIAAGFEHRDILGEDSEWTRAVWFRDPLERFLSAYLSKCAGGHEKDGPAACEATFGSRTPSFEAVAATASYHRFTVPSGRRGDAWRPQSEFCSGTLLDGGAATYGDHTYVLGRRDGMARQLGALMKAVGYEDPEDEPTFRYHFVEDVSSTRPLGEYAFTEGRLGGSLGHAREHAAWVTGEGWELPWYWFEREVRSGHQARDGGGRTPVTHAADMEQLLKWYNTPDITRDALMYVARDYLAIGIEPLERAAGARLPALDKPITTCASLSGASLGKNVTVLSAELTTTKDDTSQVEDAEVSYCLVKVLVAPAINIWVGLPTDSYNNRFMALGGGGFVGSVSAPTNAVKWGYAGATTDTGHKGSSGSFGMLTPGKPDMGLQTDFGWRSEHMMAVVSKQLIKLFYGKAPAYSYWNGCSTGGRQGQAMAQRFPDDYDGILAGAPAVHFDKLGLGQTWPQVPMLEENGGKAIAAKKLAKAVSASVEACDGLDGVKDGVLRDPRACNFSATALVGSGLTAAEAKAVDLIWRGSTNPDGSLSWYGIPRGASLDALAGRSLMSIPDGQAKYFVEFDPDWDYHSLTYENYAAFFDKTVQIMEPGPTATDNAKSISAFRDRGSKLVMWHGWADQIIMPQGTIDLYDQVVNSSDGGNLKATQEWMRLFMTPGVSHCGMDTTPFFEALVAWVEKDAAPSTILHQVSAKTTRPLCPHPQVAVYKGSGSTDDAANFACGANTVADTEDANSRVNMRLFGVPFVPSSPCPGCES